ESIVEPAVVLQKPLLNLEVNRVTERQKREKVLGLVKDRRTRHIPNVLNGTNPVVVRPLTLFPVDALLNLRDIPYVRLTLPLAVLASTHNIVHVLTVNAMRRQVLLAVRAHVFNRAEVLNALVSISASGLDVVRLIQNHSVKANICETTKERQVTSPCLIVGNNHYVCIDHVHKLKSSIALHLGHALNVHHHSVRSPAAN